MSEERIEDTRDLVWYGGCSVSVCQCSGYRFKESCRGYGRPKSISVFSRQAKST